MDKDSFSYVIYMIHACANDWEHTPSEVYKMMKRANCIMGFLVPNYEIKAMDIYYSSKLSDKIYVGKEGIQYLDYKVLVQILIETEMEII